MQPKLSQCEICGKQTKKTLKIKIGKSILQVCEACSKFGETESEKTSNAWRNYRSYPSKSYLSHEAKKKQAFRIKRKVIKPEEKEFILVDNYGKIIKNAREKLNLSQEKFAKMLNEKESVISRIESQHMKPSEKLARKIEKALNIKILEEI